MPRADRKDAALSHFMAALSAFVLLKLSSGSGRNFVPQDIEMFHRNHAAYIFRASQIVGTNGNKLAVWAFGFWNGLKLVPIAYLLGRASRWVCEFFAERPPGAEAAPPLAQRAADAWAAATPGTHIGVQLGMLFAASGLRAFAGDCSSIDLCKCYPEGADDHSGPGWVLPNWLFWRKGAGGGGGSGEMGDPPPGADGDPLPPIAPDEPKGVNVNALNDDIYNLKKQFEDLENQLGDEVNKQLSDMDDYAQDYNKAWAAAMNNLNDYLENKRLLQPTISQLAQAFRDRSHALRMAGAADDALPIVMLLTGLGAEALANEAAAGGAGGGRVPTEPSVPGDTPSGPKLPPLPEDGPLPPHVIDPEPPRSKPPIPKLAEPEEVLPDSPDPVPPKKVNDIQKLIDDAAREVDENPNPDIGDKYGPARKLLDDSLKDYYDNLNEKQPPMHTTSQEALRQIIGDGQLNGADGKVAWSKSGTLRDGDVAIRVAPDSQSFVRIDSATDGNGQIARYYPNGDAPTGPTLPKGADPGKDFVPTQYLQYFDVKSKTWVPVK